MSIILPNNSTTDGVVWSVGTVATSSGEDGAEPTIKVEVALIDPSVAGSLDEAPVLVAITTATVENALVVPVTALLSLAGGGYAVEVQDDNGLRHLVPVTPGLFDGCPRRRRGHQHRAPRRPAGRGALDMSDARPPGRRRPPTPTTPATRPTGAALLELDGVTKIYPSQPPVTALRTLSLQIGAGELVAIVGPSGSGKTTLLQIMGTLDRPTSGTVRITGLDVADLSDRQLAALRAVRIGFVFQQFFLAEHTTILDNVERRPALRRPPPR